MRDIVNISDDLTIVDAEIAKAKNVLSIQLGRLEYAPTFGIDLEFFLNPDFQFQNESFKSYLIQRLTEHRINVNRVVQSIEALIMEYSFTVGQAGLDAGGLIK